MDDVSMRTMEGLLRKYLDPSVQLKILDVGSMDAQNGQYGTYRDLMVSNWTYTGLDIEPGPNVDLVVAAHYDWGIEEEYDVIISGQCLEHVPYFWLTMEQIAKAMKPGGFHFNIVPSTGPVHRFPLDCWRLLKDGMVTVSEYVGLDVVQCTENHDSIWHNTVLVARKPE